MVAQPARVVGGRLEFAAKRVHLGQRRNLAGITEIIGISAARHRWAGGRLHGDEIGVRFAGQPVLHKGCDQAAKVRATARAADDDIRVLVIERHGLFRLQADHGLVQEHLVEHRAEHIARAGR